MTGMMKRRRGGELKTIKTRSDVRNSWKMLLAAVARKKICARFTVSKNLSALCQKIRHFGFIMALALIPHFARNSAAAQLFSFLEEPPS